MSTHLSLLWVKGPSGHVMHRKREYTKHGGRTLCGIRVGPGWVRWPIKGRKCKRCAA